MLPELSPETTVDDYMRDIRSKESAMRKLAQEMKPLPVRQSASWSQGQGKPMNWPSTPLHMTAKLSKPRPHYKQQQLRPTNYNNYPRFTGFPLISDEVGRQRSAVWICPRWGPLQALDNSQGITIIAGRRVFAGKLTC